MCPNKQKLATVLDGSRAGITGFNEVLSRQAYREKDEEVLIYVAYASTQPITGPFKPKREMSSEGYPSLEEFEEAYPDIIISVGVDMKPGTSSNRT